METLTTVEPRPVRRKFTKPPVKVACLTWYVSPPLGRRIQMLLPIVLTKATKCSRSMRIRCDGQNPCTNCANKSVPCGYVPSRRGGPRDCQNRKRRKASAPAPGPETTTDVLANSDTTDTEERRSQPSSSFETNIAQTSGSRSGPSSEDADWFDQLIDLSAPGAGLRSVEMPIAEIESIFDSIFAGDQGSANGICVEDGETPVVDMVQIYGSHGDM